MFVIVLRGIIVSFIKEMMDYGKKYDSSLFRGGYTFFRNALAYKFNMQPPKGPLYVGWDITYKCQARCSFCDRWKHEPVKELTTKQAYYIIDSLAKLKTWNISFGGGEPLLRKDLPVLIKLIKNKRIVVNVNTNGYLLKERADDLIAAGIDNITISIDSWNSKSHDEIRNCPGLFDKASEGIKYLMAQPSRPRIGVRVEVGKHNFNLIDDYIDYWQNKVDEIILQPLHDMDNDFIIPDDLLLKDYDKKEFLKHFRKLQVKYSFLNNAYYNKFPQFLFEASKIKNQYKCYAGTFTLQIDPEGNVYPCTGYCHNVGNVHNDSIKDIWCGEKMIKSRKFLKEKNNKCVCWYNCNGTINCYLTKVLH